MALASSQVSTAFLPSSPPLRLVQQMLPKSIQLLISSFIYSSDLVNGHQSFLSIPNPVQPPNLSFHLRHLHALSNTSRNIFQNVPPRVSASFLDDGSSIRTRMMNVHKPLHPPGKRLNSSVSMLGWDLEPIPAPNVTDRATLHMLAKMTSNAYVNNNEKEWYELPGNWSVRVIPLSITIPHSSTHRTIRSAGNQTKTVSEVMSSSPPTTPQLS